LLNCFVYFWRSLGADIHRAGPNYFQQQDVSVTGRIRQLTVENVFVGNEKEIVTMTRDGEFPNWRGLLSFWKFSKKDRSFQKVAEWVMPKETILYGFIPVDQGDSRLVIVLPNRVQVGKWSDGKWIFEDSQSASFEVFLKFLTARWLNHLIP
jgi:hypothetical protein